MTQPTPLTTTHDQVNLVSVSGRLDWAGLGAMQKQLDILLDAGTRFLLADLSRVTHCDNRLAEQLGRTSTLLQQRGGWLRLFNPGTSTVSAVDGTAPLAALPMDHTRNQATASSGRGRMIGSA